jgi:opacity protein-like surface antigen
MRKIISASAIFATAILASAHASALDFTILAGVDSNHGPTVAAEIGIGSVLIGFKAMGDVDHHDIIDNGPETDGYGIDVLQNQKDAAFYLGYRFSNGISTKAGFSMSTYEGSISDQRVDPIVHAAFRPMVGLGYNFTDRWSMDVHYTSAATVDTFEHESLAEFSEYTFEESVSVMAGFRF